MKTDKHLLNLNFDHHPEEAQALLDMMHAKLFIKNKKISFLIILTIIIGMVG